MKSKLYEFFVLGIRNFFRGMIANIRGINRKYEKPHIRTTPMVRVCLLILRGYLIVLVGILLYKFITVLR